MHKPNHNKVIPRAGAHAANRLGGWDRERLFSTLLIIGSPAFVVRLRFKDILDIYLSEQQNPGGSLKFMDCTRLNNRLNS
jgi:hypothetical protein